MNSSEIQTSLQRPSDDSILERRRRLFVWFGWYLCDLLLTFDLHSFTYTTWCVPCCYKAILQRANEMTSDQTTVEKLTFHHDFDMVEIANSHAEMSEQNPVIRVQKRRQTVGFVIFSFDTRVLTLKCAKNPIISTGFLGRLIKMCVVGIFGELTLGAAESYCEIDARTQQFCMQHIGAFKQTTSKILSYQFSSVHVWLSLRYIQYAWRRATLTKNNGFRVLHVNTKHPCVWKKMMTFLWAVEPHTGNAKNYYLTKNIRGYGQMVLCLKYVIYIAIKILLQLLPAQISLSSSATFHQTCSGNGAAAAAARGISLVATCESLWRRHEVNCFMQASKYRE